MKKFHIKALVVPAAAAALVLAGCSGSGSSDSGSDDSGTPATGEPIQVAALASMLYFPEGPPSAKAVFDDYNAAGGFNGRPIELAVFDDKADPAASTTAARDALASGAVALVGSSSMLDCAVNNQTWVDEGIVSLQAVSPDPFCFATPNIAPMDTGQYFDMFASLWNGSETLGFEKICAFTAPNDVAGRAAYLQVVDAWEAETGKQLAIYDDSLVRGQASYAGNVAQISTDKCDSIFIADVGPAVSAFLAEATNQGLNLPVLAQTSVYSQEFADTLVYGGDVHIPAEFSPWSDPEDPSNADWKEVMDRHNIGLTSFAQSGYLSAKAFIHILENELGADAEVTRESFTAAAKGMTEVFDTGGMTGTPWIFGEGDSHQPNAAAWPLVLEANSGEWTSLGPWFIGTDNGWVNTTVPGN